MPGNAFQTDRIRCRGYDLVEDLLPHASWPEMLWLLIQGGQPEAWQIRLLEKLAIVIANPGPRDASVRAAMNSGVSGAPDAAVLSAALAVGAGVHGGSREVELVLQLWQRCGLELGNWQQALTDPDCSGVSEIWPEIQHAPGFDPYTDAASAGLVSILTQLAAEDPSGVLEWLLQNRLSLEATAGGGLSLSGLSAAVFHALGVDPAQASFWYLWLRLPGAMAHALEQREQGWRQFPFVGQGVETAIQDADTENQDQVQKGKPQE